MAPSKRCAECGASQRMIGREGDLCAYCAGEQAHPFDRVQEAISQRNVPRYTPLVGAYDTRMPGESAEVDLRSPAVTRRRSVTGMVETPLGGR